MRVVRSEIHDIVVSIHKGLPTFWQSEPAFLSGKHKTQFRGPEDSDSLMRFSDTADFEIKRTDYYDHCDEGSLLWNDEDTIISWPIGDLTESKKGAMASLFAALNK